MDIPIIHTPKHHAGTADWRVILDHVGDVREVHHHATEADAMAEATTVVLTELGYVSVLVRGPDSNRRVQLRGYTTYSRFWQPVALARR